MTLLYSKAKLFGAPIHPMLVAFPIAAFVASAFGFLVFGLTHVMIWFRVGYYTAVVGVCTGIVAAVPGFIDWAMGIPNDSPAKRVGLLHMSLNLLVVAMFAFIGVVYAGDVSGATAPSTVPIVLSLAGVLTLLVSGYLGGRLIHVHHVGVDLTREQTELEPRDRTEAHGHPRG